MLQEGELNLNSVVLGGFFCIKAVNMDLGFSQKCVHARARAANRYQKKRRKKKRVDSWIPGIGPRESTLKLRLHKHFALFYVGRGGNKNRTMQHIGKLAYVDAT